MKKIKSEAYKVATTINLSEAPTYIDLGANKEAVEDALKKTRKALGKLQDTLYAHGKYAVLICLQGMDAAGKDSLIREVFKDFNARGVVVHSFKVPTDKEKKHNYLWRHYIALPERGKFGVFNRTHYENVLVTRVHPHYILGENLPDVLTVEDVDNDFWTRRFEQINNFEKTVAQNGTLIFKFFLNLSKEEQKHRQLRRLHKPSKNWKFSAGDLDERELWDTYMTYYQDILNKTSKSHAPWFIIPSDDKASARLTVASILLEELQKYSDIKEPQLDPETKSRIDEYIARLENE